MKSSIKHTLRSLAEASGFDVRKTSVYTSPKLRHRLLFSQLQIDLVVDVGANTGQFARQCRAAGYQGEIISFEPSAAAHASLLRSAAADPLWNVAGRMALGAADGETEINIAANSYSSSILPMLHTHLSAAPASRYLHKEKVPLRRLDDVLVPLTRHIPDPHIPDRQIPDRHIFLKLDVQGYEPHVLAGAPQLLAHTSAVQLEMSLLPLYEGEALMPEICARMSADNFDLWDFEPSFRDPTNGRLLQVDGIFTRSSSDLALLEKPASPRQTRTKEPA
jgi:FkbM family methyltransferase